MSTTPIDGLESSKLPNAQAKPEKQAASPQLLNKYAEVRLAKKKQRRRAHRATIRRSNTGG
jgi:hypothetical protein